ncbi:MAG TPA: ion channel [Chitinolyticbacter sp.]|nr:ion channel [Chitinolyticbacter sp.]
MTLTNFLVGLPAMLLCMVIQAAIAYWCVRYYIRRVSDGGRGGLRPLLVTLVAMMFGNLLQIALWGGLFVGLGEFTELYEAIYHSAVNFTSLGYGDIVMSKAWRLLGPLEAANGVLMLGMSAAAMMAILQHMIKVQVGERL